MGANGQFSAVVPLTQRTTRVPREGTVHRVWDTAWSFRKSAPARAADRRPP